MNNPLHGKRVSSDYFSAPFLADFKEKAPKEKITFGLIKKALEEKKEAIPLKNSFVDMSIDASVPLLVSAIFGFAFSIFGGIVLKDPFNEKLIFCKDKCQLLNMKSQKTEFVIIEMPCHYYDHHRDNTGGTYLPFIFSLCLLTPLFIKYVHFANKQRLKTSKSQIKLEKINQSISEIDSYAQNILKINQDGSEEEILLDDLELLPQDLKTLFPFIPNDLLPDLTFPYIENAKKYFEELFEKKLNDGRFSKEQQSIWYLFKALKDANPEKILEILSRKLNRKILGSDLLVFQYLVKMKKNEILEDNKQLIFLLSLILKEEILDPTIDPKFDDDSLIILLKSIAHDNDFEIALKEEKK